MIWKMPSIEEYIEKTLDDYESELNTRIVSEEEIRERVKSEMKDMFSHPFRSFSDILKNIAEEKGVLYVKGILSNYIMKANSSVIKAKKEYADDIINFHHLTDFFERLGEINPTLYNGISKNEIREFLYKTLLENAKEGYIDMKNNEGYKELARKITEDLDESDYWDIGL